MREEQQHPLLLHPNNPNNMVNGRITNTDDLIGEERKTWEELKKIWKIAGPSIFCRFAMFSLTIITQSLAGHLSDLDLAAFSIATTFLISISFGFLIGMATALETLCGQAYGARQHHMLGLYVQRSCVVLSFCAILLLPMFIFAAPLLKILGQSAEVAERTGLVARWLIPMHLSFVFQFSFQRFLQSQLKMAIIAWSSAVALGVHAIISWLFVYKLGVGIIGTALTLDFSWWLSVFIMYGYVLYGGCPKTWSGFSWLAFTDLWDFFKLALASGVMVLLENVYYRLLVIASGDAGSSHVAVDALSICVTLFGWESMVPLGILAATGVRVAIELGAGNVSGAKFAAKVCMLTSLIIGLIFSSLVLAIPDKLAMIFTPNSSVISVVCKLAYLLAPTIFLNSIPPVLLGIAVGSGWQALAAYINIGSYYLVGFPLGIFIGRVLNFGYMGIWAGMLGGSVIQILLLAIVAVKYGWEKEYQLSAGSESSRQTHFYG
ncbi:protein DETOXIFICATION 27-like isoform X2 [Chenopodium quinoa]|uniref:protein DETOXIFICATION 27-like isoform X2 n=1 Tax=Chenopodium quinoa TaxID=63459 RepID=UPI000B779E6E|nr:protein DETOXIFICATION 27-like isoform X2 [Chenopodium quinoa]